MDVIKKRTSKSQFQIYIRYLKEHKVLVTGKLQPTSEPHSLDNLWHQLMLELNSCGNGPIRDVASWKKAFTEWKSSCRKKARDNKPLSDLEAAVIELTGSGAVSGMDVEELGLAVNYKEKEANYQETAAGEPSGEPMKGASTCNVIPSEKRRAKKITYQQYLMYVTFLENKEDNFKQLCTQLNKIDGPKKTVQEWQEAFWKWKASVRRKAREIYVSHHLTGGGFPIPKVLTDLEEKLLYILGILCIKGMPISELGFAVCKVELPKIKTEDSRTKGKVTFAIKKSARAQKIYKKTLTVFQIANKKYEDSLKQLVKSVEKLVEAIKRYLNVLLYFQIYK